MAEFPSTLDSQDRVDRGMGVKDVPRNKLAAEAAEPTSRRITNNNQYFHTGGYILPAQTAPKIQHKAVFESAGSKFTVAELAAAFTRLPLAAKASEVSIKSWGQHFNPTGVHAEKDAQVAIIEWEE